MSDLTDFTSHHIEGFAIHGNTPFRVPLVSHVVGNLWQGGCKQGVKLPDDFDFVVSLYPWERYDLGPATARLECKLYDAAEIPDERQLEDLAKIVGAFARKGKTLVHCQAGLNRSGLISGLSLVREFDFTPRAAVELLRLRRCEAVLCNAQFEQWLLSQTINCACGAGCTDGVCTAEELGEAV